MADATRHCPCCSQILPNERGITVNLDENAAVIDNYAVRLTGVQAKALAVLVERMPGAISRRDWSRAVYGPHSGLRTERAIDTVANRLRRALGGTAVYIENIQDTGWRLARREKGRAVA